MLLETVFSDTRTSISAQHWRSCPSAKYPEEPARIIVSFVIGTSGFSAMEESRDGIVANEPPRVTKDEHQCEAVDRQQESKSSRQIRREGIVIP